MPSENKKIPPDLLSILWNISTKIPVSIISSKDLQFLRNRIPFARIVSSLMGLETTQLALPARNFTYPTETENLITQYHLADGAELTGNSKLLADLAHKVEGEFQDLSIESKFTYVDHILAGISLDYRHLLKWERYKANIEPEVKKMIQRFIESSSPSNLFLQIYSDHPFIDVYAIECDKGKALDTVSRLLSIKEEGKILYLGDSENDNLAFRKADLSIGIRSDQRIKTKLNSDYILEFRELGPFLQKLQNEDFIFDRISQQLI